MSIHRDRFRIAPAAIALALVCAAVGFVLLVLPRPEPVETARLQRAQVDEDAGSRLDPAGSDAGAARTERTASEAPADAADLEGLAPAEEAASIEDAQQELRTALEESLYNTMDPGAILDAALELGRLDVDQRAFSEPDPSGCTVYPLLGAPEGTQAELWVGRSSKPEVKNVLSLRVELPPGEPPYVFSGCARAKAIAQVQMQLDDAGNPLNLTILTDFPPAVSNRDLGIAVDEGTIPQGVLYYFDAKDLGHWQARTHGLKEGKPGSWTDDQLLLAGNWPCPEKVEAFRGLLQKKYETVRR